MQKINISVNSEIGKLEGVIIHQPSSEIESMSPENADKALYSDILNLRTALTEYSDFKAVLKKYTNVFEVSKLLEETLRNESARSELVTNICAKEKSNVGNICNLIDEINNKILAKQLIQGIRLTKDNLTKFLSDDRYAFNPLPNLFFTRDASFSVGNKVMISTMASDVRDRETIIMDAIFKYHPAFMSTTVNAVAKYDSSGMGTIEGGDVLIARNDILIIGNGDRTSTQGVDAIIEYTKTKPGIHNVIVQQLPHKPESFIHLDMVFTLIDKNKCMIFEPLILSGSSYATVHITIENHKVKDIKYVKNILSALKSLGIDLEPVYCGGKNETIIMKREQWHSGANFFTLEPGKIVGYGRNSHTIEALNNVGFDIVAAKDIALGTSCFEDHNKMVITIEGNELSRGGGGARCMTMPVMRQDVRYD